jgi:ketosteroid isomerase-like protein
MDVSWMTNMDEQVDLVHRLRRAVDEHDLDALVDCFTPDYLNETPAHPGRGFAGRDQVRTNWQRIFDGVPDITADILRFARDGTEIWSEWEMRGTRIDGQTHLMRGVIIFATSDEGIASARFYLEPVDSGDDGINGAVGKVVDTRQQR